MSIHDIDVAEIPLDVIERATAARLAVIDRTDIDGALAMLLAGKEALTQAEGCYRQGHGSQAMSETDEARAREILGRIGYGSRVPFVTSINAVACALSSARREGAEQMRDQIAHYIEITGAVQTGGDRKSLCMNIAAAVRALPGDQT